MSTMYLLCAWLTARASWMNRATTSGLPENSRLITLMATFLPMTGWIPLYTVPMPPLPRIPVISYWSTMDPVCRVTMLEPVG